LSMFPHVIITNQWKPDVTIIAEQKTSPTTVYYSYLKCTFSSKINDINHLGGSEPLNKKKKINLKQSARQFAKWIWKRWWPLLRGPYRAQGSLLSTRQCQFYFFELILIYYPPHYIMPTCISRSYYIPNRSIISGL